MSRAAAPGGAVIASAGKRITSYIKQSELPLHSLVFLLPAMVLFELGMSFHPSDPIAFRLRHLGDERSVTVLKTVAAAARWDTRPSPGPDDSRGGRGSLQDRAHGAGRRHRQQTHHDRRHGEKSL